MRDGRLDLIRVIMIACVICIHTFCVLDWDVWPQYRTTGLVLNVICHIAVPVFAMLSGIVLASRCDCGLPEFYKRRLLRILVPLTPCTIFFVLLRLYRDGEPWMTVWCDTLRGAPYYHLWFAFMLLGVYVLMPFLARLEREIRARYILVGSSLFILGSRYSGEGFLHVVPFAAYALMGMTIYRWWRFSFGLIGVFLAAIILFGAIGANAAIVLNTNSFSTMGYCSLYVMAASMSFLCLVLSLPQHVGRGVFWARASSFVFGVYLWHPVFKGVSMRIVDMLPYREYFIWLCFPLTLSLAFIAIAILSRVRFLAFWLGSGAEKASNENPSRP